MMPMSMGGAGGAAAAVPTARAKPAKIAVQSLLFIRASCWVAEGDWIKHPPGAGVKNLVASARKHLPKRRRCPKPRAATGSHGHVSADTLLTALVYHSTLERKSRVADDLAGGGGRSRDAAAG